jgi:hypothetical protein
MQNILNDPNWPAGVCRHTKEEVRYIAISCKAIIDESHRVEWILGKGLGSKDMGVLSLNHYFLTPTFLSSFLQQHSASSSSPGHQSQVSYYLEDIPARKAGISKMESISLLQTMAFSQMPIAMLTC